MGDTNDVAVVLAAIKDAGDAGVRIEAIQKSARLGRDRCRTIIGRLVDANLVTTAPRSNGKRFVAVAALRGR